MQFPFKFPFTFGYLSPLNFRFLPPDPFSFSCHLSRLFQFCHFLPKKFSSFRCLTSLKFNSLLKKSDFFLKVLSINIIRLELIFESPHFSRNCKSAFSNFRTKSGGAYLLSPVGTSATPLPHLHLLHPRSSPERHDHRRQANCNNLPSRLRFS